MPLNKTDLIDAVAKSTELKKIQIEKTINATFDAIKKELGQMFGRGVDSVKRFNLVNQLMIQFTGHLLQHFLESLKIYGHAQIIELPDFHLHHHLPVVAMNFAARSRIALHLMGG